MKFLLGDEIYNEEDTQRCWNNFLINTLRGEELADKSPSSWCPRPERLLCLPRPSGSSKHPLQDTKHCCVTCGLVFLNLIKDKRNTQK